VDRDKSTSTADSPTAVSGTVKAGAQDNDEISDEMAERA
jgi:hypothetical protein